MDVELKELDEIISAAKGVHKQGIGIVLVSMGAKGIVLIGEKGQLLASPPKIEVKNTIGAGDSSVAGFVHGLVKGKSLREALINSVAAGTATTLMPGTALCQKDDFLRLVQEVKVRII